MTGRVVHVNDRIEDAYYIGRGMGRQGLRASPFANAYKIGDTSLYNRGEVFENGVQDDRAPLTRIDVMNRYSGRIVDKPDLLAKLPDLRGRPLACWCRHDGEAKRADNLCHGDVLLLLLGRYTDAQLRYTAAYDARSHATWTMEAKPIGTVQRFIKRHDDLLFGDQPPPEMDIRDIGATVVGAIRTASAQGIKLDTLLAAYVAARFAETYGDPVNIGRSIVAESGSRNVRHVGRTELWEGLW